MPPSSTVFLMCCILRNMDFFIYVELILWQSLWGIFSVYEKEDVFTTNTSLLCYYPLCQACISRTEGCRKFNKKFHKGISNW